MPDFNLNPTNGILIAGGLAALFLPIKLPIPKTIKTIVGVGAAAIGAADMLGIFTFTQLNDVVGKVTGANYASSHYAVPQYPYPY